MKRLDDHSPEELLALTMELLALTMEQVDELVSVECAHHLQHANALERYTRDKEAYDKDRREFESTNSARTAVSREVWGAVEEARDAQRTIENLKAQFAEYCRIADGDRSTALKFLLAATPHDEAFVRTTLNMELPMEATEHDDEEG